MIMTAKTRERATIIKEFGELTAAELYEIMKARFKVFVMEQRCWYLDFDDIDYACVHIFIMVPPIQHVPRLQMLQQA
jgi:predicted GNAT family N-acyltransferase